MSWHLDGTSIRRLASQVIAEYGATCWLCGKPINLDADRRTRAGLTLDHVLPVSQGGADSLDNLRPAHKGCNSKRQDRPPSTIRRPDPPEIDRRFFR